MKTKEEREKRHQIKGGVEVIVNKRVTIWGNGAEHIVMTIEQARELAKILADVK